MNGTLTWILTIAVLALTGWPIYREVRRIRALEDWPHKVARITNSQLKNIGGPSGLFQLRMAYEYTVDGTLHQGSGEIGTGKGGTQQGAEDLTRRYSVGCSLPIVYNPRRQAESFILHDSCRRLDWSRIAPYVWFALFAVASLVGLVLDALPH